jgi:O-antigen ligase
MAFLSIFTSVRPPTTISAFVDAVIIWYVPLLVILHVVRSDGDAVTVTRVLGWCAIFVTCAGAVEFVLHKNLFILMIPPSLRSALAEEYPLFATMIGALDQVNGGLVNGLFRASSTFNTALSFGEFEAMMLPIGYFFLFHSAKIRDSVFGAALTGFCLAGLVFAGARGGYIGAILNTVAFGTLLVVRLARSGRQSLLPALVVVVGISGVAALIGVLAVSTRISNIVVGAGGLQNQSTQDRVEQWELAKPKILDNPVTGYGLGMGAEVVGWHADTRGSLDSYAISTLVETGVPGFVFFFAMIFSAAARGLEQGVRNLSRSGALAAALGCSLFGFGAYRFAMSQTENFTLVFAMIGLVMLLASTQVELDSTKRP